MTALSTVNAPAAKQDQSRASHAGCDPSDKTLLDSVLFVVIQPRVPAASARTAALRPHSLLDAGGSLGRGSNDAAVLTVALAIACTASCTMRSLNATASCMARRQFQVTMAHAGAAIKQQQGNSVQMACSTCLKRRAPTGCTCTIELQALTQMPHREEGEGSHFGCSLLLWLERHGEEPVVVLVQADPLQM
jgi:hypothetical protein